jgi:hypothetical protein
MAKKINNLDLNEMYSKMDDMWEDRLVNHNHTDDWLSMDGGDSLKAAIIDDNHVVRLMDGTEAPKFIQALKIPKDWKGLHINLNAKGNTLVEGVNFEGQLVTIKST